MIDATKKNVLSLILYSQKTGPRYFEINKTFSKFFFLILPLVTLVSLCMMLLGIAYFKQLKLMFTRQESETISSLKKEKVFIQAQLSELQQINKNIEEKLSSTSVDSDKSGRFSIFKIPKGQKNLMQKSYLSVDKVQVVNRDNNIHLQFGIVNQTRNNQRLSGFIFVIMKVGHSYSIWSRKQSSSDEIQYVFSDGESFSMSNFRPVDAVFPRPKDNVTPLFQIVIFSRTGDLFYQQLHSGILGS